MGDATAEEVSLCKHLSRLDIQVNSDDGNNIVNDDDGHPGHQHHCPRLPHPDRELPPAGVDRTLPLQLRLRLPDLQDEEGDARDDQVRMMIEVMMMIVMIRAGYNNADEEDTHGLQRHVSGDR